MNTETELAGLKERLYYTPAVNTIFLMMGHSCNFQCKYCLQHPLVTHDIGTQVSDELINFIKGKALRNPFPIQLQFYGGEPLVYFDTMKDIVARLDDVREYVRFSVITNGSLLTPEKVFFLNRNNFSVSVSWDGKNSKTTRGKDVFADSRIVNCFLNVHSAGISSVISSCAYPWDVAQDIDELNTLYKERQGHDLFVCFDEIMDTGLCNRELLDLDYSRVSADIQKILGEFAKFLDREPYSYASAQLISTLINTMEANAERNGAFTRCFCGNGYSTLNADMQGNLYYCHNSTESYGTVNGGFWPLMTKVMTWDKTKERNALCSQCPVQLLCANGCPLITDTARKESYCKLKRAMFEPVMNFVQNVGKKLKEDA